MAGVGTHAYLGSDHGLGVVDLTVPSPFQETLVPDFDGAFIGEIEIVGTHAYLGSNDLLIADIQDPGSPVLVGSAPTLPTSSISVYGPYVYLVSASVTSMMQVVDVSMPTAPTIVGSVEVGNGRDVDVRGNFAYADFLNSALAQ